MIASARGRSSGGDARALRFLLLLLGGWTLVRVTAHWNPALPPPQNRLPPAPWERAAPAPPWAWADAPAIMPRAGEPAAAAPPRLLSAPFVASSANATADGGGWNDVGRHGLRLAMMARVLPPPGGTRAAFPAGRKAWMTVPDLGRTAPPGAGEPFWMQRRLAGWSLDGWVYARRGSGQSTEGIAAASHLGGSQAGVRLAYGFGDSGRLRAYARATVALAVPRQRDVALGFAFAPVSRWPVDVAVEQRLAAGGGGRTALAAMIVGGVGDVALPRDFRLEAYGQAGVVGARRRDAFVDAALVVDREIARTPQGSLHIGGFAAGAAQPGVARIDVGPRVTLRLPQIGEGSRVALDWRQRVAGDAEPGSGLALTLAAGF